MNPEWAAIAVTALATFLVWRQTNRVSERADRIQERLAAVEEARREEEVEARRRAEVTAWFDRNPRPKGKLALYVQNDGPAVARKVDFVMGPEANSNGPILREPGFPLVALAVGRPYEVRANATWGSPPSVTAKLSWTDEVGDHEEEITLSVPGV